MDNNNRLQDPELIGMCISGLRPVTRNEVWAFEVPKVSRDIRNTVVCVRAQKLEP